MNVITINVGQGGCNAAPLLIGYAGEDSVDAVDFDFSAWEQDYGEGTISLELMRASDTAPYLAILTVDGTTARWTVSDVDTARSGPGVAQLIYKPALETKKSAIYKFYVGRSLTEPGGDDPWGPIIERMEEILAEMREQAAAADQSAEDAEAWAVGERGGEPVPVTDETHENNAKYYAEQARETAREFSEVTAPAAVRAVNEAGAAKVQQINEAGTGALEAIGTARTGALDAIGTAGRTAVSAVDAAKTGAVQDINAAKTDALTAIEQKSTEEQAAVEQKGEDALAALQEYADLPGEVDNLKSAINTKAPVIINSASGNPANFTDGADNMQIREIVGTIEPIQAGSGDPSPENVRPISGRTGCVIYHSGADAENPQSLNIAWETEAGTIYGGIVTLNSDGSADIIRTYALNNLGDLNWTKSGSLFESSKVLNAIITAGLITCFCDVYKAIANQTTPKNGQICFNPNGSYPYLRIGDANYTTAADFKAAMAGHYIVYLLLNERRQTYHFDNVGKLYTFLGTNNVWVDSGVISGCKYPADTKLYIDTKFADLQALVLENIGG